MKIACSFVLICAVVTRPHAAQGPVAQDSGPTLDRTLSYINSSLSEFGVAHHPCTDKNAEYDETDQTGKITLSPDHRAIIHVAYTCFITHTSKIPALAVKDTSVLADSNGRTIVLLNCADGSKCEQRLYEQHGTKYKQSHSEDSLQVEIPTNEEVGKRLGKAFQHLVHLLKAEASRKLDPNDPFAPGAGGS